MLSNLIDRIKLPFRKEKEFFLALYDIVGFYPHNIDIYKTALMHKSMRSRNEKGRPVNNERLEFLGDAVLDSVVGHIVFNHFPGKREGFLTNTRSKIVQRETLNRLAEEMGINRLIQSSCANTSHNSHMGGNAFEALVGAIYLDRGYNACMRFMEKQVLAQLINIDKVAYKEVNFKSKLIEWSQKNRIRLEFRLLSSEKDKDGNPTFCYKTVLEGIDGDMGRGYSKKESQQLASRLTMNRLRKQPKFIDAVFAAKSARTKMEEMPVGVLEREAKQDFIISDTNDRARQDAPEDFREDMTATAQAADDERRLPRSGEREDEFDLSDVRIKDREESYEEIIAAAEASAFAEN
ncbi:MAG: ribonuclease III [Prevotella sp.]|uniref:ribonuclease III n=1 Tax=Prevotella sp. TaxID=59823 RepID=UPI002A28BEF8|nr:ribonuclease III [Prevotella sp.]MDD7317290.1 ribonuclease III [Prevotellaceae bacterium]MDY4019894.1 ribonuclease III [Prevotella sp.]